MTDVYVEALIEAARDGDVAVMRKIMKDDFVLNTVTLSSLYANGMCGVSALHMACVYGRLDGRLDAVKLLLDAGCDYDGGDAHFGNTPLIWAIINGHEDVAEELIQRGANIDKRDNSKLSALYYACGEGDADIVKFLIEHNANVNNARDNGMAPLMHASNERHACVVEELLKYNVAIDTTNNQGETALHLACHNTNKDIVQMLISNGANMDVCDKSGLSALCVLAQYGHCAGVNECVRVLLKQSLANASDCVALGGDVHKLQSEMAIRVLEH